MTGQPGYPNPLKRVVINPRVCEGCGDCSKQSNCLSIAPLETPWGRKRTIDQSTCNKDYSCLQGLCPSLVTVEQADLATHSHDPDFQRFEQVTRHLEPPRFVQGPEVLHERYSILIDGVGGTGVVTIGAWLGMAAHLQGFEVSVLDMAGLAQKGGAVFSHVQLAPPGQELAAPKIPVGEADFLLGGDEIVSASPSTLEILKDTAKAVVNVDTPPTADLIGNRDWAVPIRLLNDDLEKAIENPAENLFKVSAQKAMHDLLGDTVFANAFLLGVSWQMGAIPLHQSSLQKAIELNAVQVKANWMAFQLGRLAFADPPRFQALLETEPIQEETVPMAIERMAGELVAYQSEALALRFENKVEAWVPVLGRNSDLHLDYASTYYRLLAFKDEYEVARLLSDSAWQHEVLSGFEKGAQLKFHFAPSWLAGHDRPKKRSFGRGVTPFLWLLAKGKVIRGSWLDPFRNTQERRDQRKLVDLFEAWQPSGDPKQTQTVLKLFNQVKGFGQVRAESFKLVVQELLDFCSPNSRTSANGQDRKQNGQEEIKTG